MNKSLTNGDAMPDYSANGEVMLKPAINGNSNIFNTENANGLYANRQQQETFLQAMHMFSAADVDSILGAVELGEYHTICDLGGRLVMLLFLLFYCILLVYVRPITCQCGLLFSLFYKKNYITYTNLYFQFRFSSASFYGI